MANAAGKSIAISIESAVGGVFNALGGSLQKSLRFNGQTIDITDSESTDLFQELLDGGGVKSVEISVSGHSKDDAGIARVKTRFMTGALSNFRAVIPSFIQVDGLFQITSFEITGNHDGAVDYSLTISSSGKPTLTDI